MNPETADPLVFKHVQISADCCTMLPDMHKQLLIALSAGATIQSVKHFIEIVNKK